MSFASVDITGDGGVVKTILEKGTGNPDDTPKQGFDVVVLYVGRLTSGEIFDQSNGHLSLHLELAK